MLNRAAPEIAIQKARGHFFDRATMKTFKTFVSGTCYETPSLYVLVISNKRPGSYRHYRVVTIDKEHGLVSYVGEIYKTGAAAKRDALNFLENN